MSEKPHERPNRLAIRRLIGFGFGIRNKGLESVLIDEAQKRGVAKGYKRGEMSWVLEDNRAMNRAIEAIGARLYKTYRIYEKEL